MSSIQMEPRRHTATHSLNRILWPHVSNSNGAQETHSNSLPGWDFMALCQQFKWSPGDTQQLTSWMGFYSPMSAIQMELRRHTATHILDGILQPHVSNSDGAQEPHSNSHPGWNFMEACQQFKWSPGGTQQLTAWMGFHGGMSAIQMNCRRHTTTHILDNFIEACQQFKWSPQQLTSQMEFQGGTSVIRMEHRRHTATYILHIGQIICAVTLKFNFLLPSSCYIQNQPFHLFEILTFFPLSFAQSVYCQMCFLSHPHTEYQG